MDELMISGRRHAASIRIAKQYGYHSDYIGQLIRGNKVKGQKVGRSWYVDIESLAEYLGKEVPPAPKNITEPVGVPVEREEKKAVTLVAAPVVESVEEAITTPAVEPDSTSSPQAKPTPVVVEEKVEIKSEPVVAAEVSHHVPVTVRTTQVEEKTEPQKSAGLTYVSEEETLLPPIQKNKAPRKLDIEVEAIVQAEVSPKQKSEIEEVPVRTGYAGQVFALAGIALAVLGLVTASSSLLVYSMSAGPAQTASIHFSMPN
jgi:hypothetical protein